MFQELLLHLTLTPQIFFFFLIFFMKPFLHCFFFLPLHSYKVSFLFTMVSSFYLSYQSLATTISLLYMLLFLFNHNSPDFLPCSSSSFHPFFLTNFFSIVFSNTSELAFKKFFISLSQLFSYNHGFIISIKYLSQQQRNVS